MCLLPSLDQWLLGRWSFHVMAKCKQREQKYSRPCSELAHSCQPTFHWPKQVMWPNLPSVGWGSAPTSRSYEVTQGGGRNGSNHAICHAYFCLALHGWEQPWGQRTSLIHSPHGLHSAQSQKVPGNIYDLKYLWFLKVFMIKIWEWWVNLEKKNPNLYPSPTSLKEFGLFLLPGTHIILNGSQ